MEGKTAVVTGAGSGIGRVTSLRLAQRGYAVACLDVRGEAAGETAGSTTGAVLRIDGGAAA